MRKGSTWRSVRLPVQTLREDLHRRHSLWLHGWCIGLLVLGVMWGVSHLQFVMGSDSLAIRYVITLGAGFLAYLAVLRIWAGWLVSGDERGVDGAGDVAELAMNLGSEIPLPSRAGVPSGLGDLAGGALEAAGSSDEGAVVVVPVVAVFLIGLAVLFGAGSLLLLYFGAEALLAVAVELSFTYVVARTAVKVERQGWMEAVVRLTWKPLLGALACAVLLGLTIDWFVPQARSLPQAIQLILHPAPGR